MKKFGFLKKPFFKKSCRQNICQNNNLKRGKAGNLPSFLLGFLGCGGCMMVVAVGLFLVFASLGSFKNSGSSFYTSGNWGSGGGDLANPNTLTAQQADNFFKKNNSPLFGSGQGLIAAAQKFKVNPIFMIGISGAESTLGKYGRALDNKNPGNIKKRSDGYENYGINVIGYDDENHAIFASWEDGWMGLALVLRKTYFDKGKTTLEEIASTYLTGNQENWINNIKNWMNEVEKYISS